jgi:beta-glucosidase
MNAGGGVSLDGWLARVAGLVWAWYPGQEGGTAIAEVLFGKTNPSGKLPITLAQRYEDHPSTPYYEVNEGGRTPYAEGLLVGYRGFDAAKIEPAFPFGFGLSYTNFEYSQLALEPREDGSVGAAFTITNTGPRAGDEVAEVYVAPPAGRGRPPQKLEGFARVSLAAGASKRVTVMLPPRAFAYWADGWVIDAGRYEVRVGASSRDRRLVSKVDLPAARLPK